MPEVGASPRGRNGFVGWGECSGGALWLYGSCVLVATVDSKNADVQITDMGPLDIKRRFMREVSGV